MTHVHDHIRHLIVDPYKWVKPGLYDLTDISYLTLNTTNPCKNPETIKDFLSINPQACLARCSGTELLLLSGKPTDISGDMHTMNGISIFDLKWATRKLLVIQFEPNRRKAPMELRKEG